MVMRSVPSQTFLCQCFHYDPHTGKLWWKSRPHFHFRTQRGCGIFNTNFAGTRITALDGAGYIVVNFSGIGKFQAHRLIWCWMTGDNPPANLDHKNGDRVDNRWTNLRLATRRQNGGNQGARITNTTGFKGVSMKKRRFISQIANHYLGSFATPEEAHDVYCRAAKELYGEFACNGRNEND